MPRASSRADLAKHSRRSVPPWLQDVRAVLFDLDNTLYDHTRASREALLATARLFQQMEGVDGDVLVEEFTRHNDACWELAARGLMTREELAVARFERTLASLGVEELDAMRLADAYVERYRTRPAEVDGARETVLRLRQRLPVGLVTNGFPHLVEDKLAAIGLTGAFAPVVVASTIEVMKPRPDCFHIAVRELGFAPERVLAVGDSLVADVAGAAAAGLRTCWFDRGAATPRPHHAERDGTDGFRPEAPAPIQADLVIDRLAVLPELLFGGAADATARHPNAV